MSGGLFGHHNSKDIPGTSVLIIFQCTGQCSQQVAIYLKMSLKSVLRNLHSKSHSQWWNLAHDCLLVIKILFFSDNFIHVHIYFGHSHTCPLPSLTSLPFLLSLFFLPTSPLLIFIFLFVCLPLWPTELNYSCAYMSIGVWGLGCYLLGSLAVGTLL